MSFLYPRLINITRPGSITNKGQNSYQGLNENNETTIALNVIANIQQIQNNKQMPTNLPSDLANGTGWNIFFNLPNGTINDRDVITDELGIRYQVTAAYWNSLGYRALCYRLDT